MSIEIIPAILPPSIGELRSSLARVKGAAKTVQIDICDGKFVPNTTWPYQNDDGTFDRVRREAEGLPFWEDFDFELDLMIGHPESAISEWIKAGATRVIPHFESTEPDMLHDLIEEWSHVIEFGLAVHNDTPIEEITGFIDSVSFIQCMGIRRIGFQGEKFDERTVERVRELRQKFPNLVISVDGGVTLETAPGLIEAGVNRLVAGSAILKSDDPLEAIKEFKVLG